MPPEPPENSPKSAVIHHKKGNLNITTISKIVNPILDSQVQNMQRTRKRDNLYPYLNIVNRYLVLFFIIFNLLSIVSC